MSLEEKEEDEEIEMLDFEPDEVSDKIDEMLDFIDVSDEEVEKLEETTNLDKLLLSAKKETQIEIEKPEKKLDEYEPSIKDFNIKSAKTRKIVKKSMLYVVILMLLGFEIFINKTGDILTSLKAFTGDNEPIRIVQNERYGYMNHTGNKIVSPKYTYGEKFTKGYAIVKNSSNLPLIIDRSGKEAVSTGNYFSIYRAEEDIITSKVTKKGLKYGIIDASLKEKVPFIYDSISYLGGVYSYTKGNEVGLINIEGKPIYKYKLTDKEDKQIEVKTSPIAGEKRPLYGVVKVNSSSSIVNLKTGKVVYKPTLNELNPEENNVFYQSLKAGKRKYIYIQDDKVLLERDDYTSLSIKSISAGVLKAITTSYKYEFISTKTLEQIKKGLILEETYEGDNVFMYVMHNYKKNISSIVMVKNGEVFKTIEEDFTIYKGFSNGIAIVKFNDGMYGYLNEEGSLITNERFIEAGGFDAYGDAIAKKDSGYGVIHKNGNIIIPFENSDIKMASSELKKKTSIENKNVFYAVKKDNRYGLYNSKGKKVNKKFYNEVEFNPVQPVLKISTDINDALLMIEEMKEINITSFNTEYEAFENYIILKNEYYNYYGKLIYTDNSKEESDGV